MANDSAATTWHDATSAIAAIVTAVALVVGGGWAYFRFLRGRTFARRAEVAVAGALLRAPLSGLRIHLAVKNTGASRITLSDVRFLETYCVSESDWPQDANVDWGEPTIRTRVLQHHDWIESAEIVNEDVLVPVPPADAAGKPYVAFLVRAHVSTTKRRGKRHPTGWTANSIVLPEAMDARKEVEARIPR